MRIFHKYTDWEDFNNGMYSIENKPRDSMVSFCIQLLSDQNLFAECAKRMVKEWSISAEENLTNVSCNRKAWIGQASCSYNHKATESETRISWSLITPKQREEANKTAESIINEYERAHTGLYFGVEEQVLFN